MRLLDPKFRYIPSTSTSVSATWKKFGYRPTTDAERCARQRGLSAPANTKLAEVTRLQPRRKLPR